MTATDPISLGSIKINSMDDIGLLAEAYAAKAKYALETMASASDHAVIGVGDMRVTSFDGGKCISVQLQSADGAYAVKDLTEMAGLLLAAARFASSVTNLPSSRISGAKL